jgi:hypothetical protein
LGTFSGEEGVKVGKADRVRQSCGAQIRENSAIAKWPSSFNTLSNKPATPLHDAQLGGYFFAFLMRDHQP